MLNSIYMADMAMRAPVPTTTTVAGRFKPTPTGPVQFGAKTSGAGFRLMLTLVQAPNNPARAGLLPTTGVGALMFLATKKLNIHCSQLFMLFIRSWVQKQDLSFAPELQLFIVFIMLVQLLWHELTASTLGRLITFVIGTCVTPSKEIVKSARACWNTTNNPAKYKKAFIFERCNYKLTRARESVQRKTDVKLEKMNKLRGWRTFQRPCKQQLFRFCKQHLWILQKQGMVPNNQQGYRQEFQRQSS